MLDFNKIKDYFDRSLWTKDMVRGAVTMKKITEEQFKEIVGENYIA